MKWVSNTASGLNRASERARGGDDDEEEKERDERATVEEDNDCSAAGISDIVT